MKIVELKLFKDLKFETVNYSKFIRRQPKLNYSTNESRWAKILAHSYVMSVMSLKGLMSDFL